MNAGRVAIILNLRQKVMLARFALWLFKDGPLHGYETFVFCDSKERRNADSVACG
jgi:hypothetical protein